MAIVYRHIRRDSDEVFYVGISKHKSRAFSKHSRTKHWEYIVRKCGYRVEITHEDVCWEEACSIEKYLISFYGKKMNGGSLVNITDGGDSVIIEGNTGENNPFFGKKHSPEVMEAISRKAKERSSTKEWKDFMSKVHKGKVISDEQLKVMSMRSRRGNNPRAKKVIDTATGIVYECVRDAAEALGYNWSTLRSYLNSGRGNKTTLRNYDQ